MVDEKSVRESLIEVEDPEMKISVIDLGLIYGVSIDDSHAEIDMTLTRYRCEIVYHCFFGYRWIFVQQTIC